MHNKLQIVTMLILVGMMGFIDGSFSQAQEANTNLYTRGVKGYFMAGANIFDLDELNATLRRSSYPAFSDNLFSFGGGGHLIINRLLIGGEGHGLLTKEKSVVLANRLYKSSLEISYGFVTAGYQVIANGGFSFYPLLGIGGGIISMKIHEKTPASFDEILANPGRNATLTMAGFLVHASLGGDYFFVVDQDAGERRGLIVGFRAGYNFAPLKSDWQLDEFEIAGGPDIDVTGPYVRLLIGGGELRSK
jgi:hypothetical protein